MNMKFNLILIFFVHFCRLWYTVLPNGVDRAALLAIKSQITQDPNGVLRSWNESTSVPICEWHGVTCGGTTTSYRRRRRRRRVVVLHLEDSGLVGTLSPHVGNLTFLNQLHLGNNTFSGQIPSQIGNLVRLTDLVLERNGFQGEIPANLSGCLNLQKLGLAGNNLTGIVPSQLGRLYNLQVLSIQRNRLTGNLLNDVVVNLTSLRMLSALNNFFHGTIPDNIGVLLRNLTYIELFQNQISGTIPPSFYNLSSLEVVDFDSNKLRGTIQSDIGIRLPQLTYFKMSSNFFHGSLPVSLSNLTQLELLAVYSNNFTGKFTFSARNMPNFRWLDISHNYLGTGDDDLSFLQTFVNCTNLQLLGCGVNNFGGNIPPVIGNLSKEITEITVDYNQITGTIPMGLFNLINLNRLNLESNHLIGYLAPEIGKLRNLQSFSCNNNILTGNIPYSLGNLSWLSELYLEQNSFEGTIPSSLGQLKNLLYLSISTNKLTGAVPPSLFYSTSMLVELHLDQNNLRGIIPVEINQLRNLVLLDISGNNFSGEIPATLSGCTSLVQLYMGGNFFTGFIPPSFKALTSLTSLNLSHNYLSGPIPSFLGNFSLIQLDLSFNQFQGEVPTNGVFANLTDFTILENGKLCGGIQELHLPTCPTPNTTPNKKSTGKMAIVIIVVASLVVGVSILLLVYFLVRKKKKKLELKSIETMSKVSYDMLLKATNGFSEANLVGAGSFGCVYKGVNVIDPENSMVDDDDVVVAIKVISLKQRGASKSFTSECETLRSIRHRNLVKIITVCSSIDFHGNDFKALVYEFMSNGNLHQWIHLKKGLTLVQRVDVAIGVASAVDYLHNGCQDSIIHCDLKPTNILLDDDMVAHLGDFGLARFHLQHQTETGNNNSSSIAVKGTVGYAPPEYGLGSMVSKEGDIYSYGIVLIEMITSKKPTDTMFEGGLNLHNYAKSAALSDQLIRVIDPKLLEDDDDDDDDDRNENEILAEMTGK